MTGDGLYILLTVVVMVAFAGMVLRVVRGLNARD